MLIASALTVLSCGLCRLIASQTPIGAYILNWPRSTTSHEPSRRTTATLWTDKVDYKKDEPIHIRFTVKHTSGRPLVFERKDGPVMDLTISFTGYTEPYRWSELYPDQMRALRRLELQAGEERTSVTPVAEVQALLGGLAQQALRRLRLEETADGQLILYLD